MSRPQHNVTAPGTRYDALFEWGARQLSNEPSAPAGQGRFMRLAPTALDMFFRYYAPKEDGS